MTNYIVKTLCTLTGATTDLECEKILDAVDKAIYAFYCSLQDSGIEQEIAEKLINIIF